MSLLIKIASRNAEGNGLTGQPNHPARKCTRLLHSEWFGEGGGAVDEPADDGVHHNLRVDRVADPLPAHRTLQEGDAPGANGIDDAPAIGRESQVPGPEADRWVWGVLDVEPLHSYIGADQLNQLHGGC